jgi:hypothetical protein
VDEQASGTIQAEPFIIKLVTVFRLVLLALLIIHAHELAVAMGVLALAEVATLSALDPVLAELGLVLYLLDFGVERRK